MNLRKKICVWLFDVTKLPYAKYFKKNEAWNISTNDLLEFPKDSLGRELGKFLDGNQFSLIPKLEKHDAYHVITEFGTSVEQEIALQYFFWGNGKKSIYMYAVISVGFLLVPEYYQLYFKSYNKGKNTNPVYNLNIKKLLTQPLNSIKNQIGLNKTNLKPVLS